MDFYDLLDQIDQEVARRKSDEADLDAAYGEALQAVIKRMVEGRKTQAFEDRLLAALRSLSKAQGGRPVSTTRLAVELGQTTWSTWYYLAKLERRGLIHRPAGSKSGWAAS
jgi:hypothetical protein